MSWIKRYPLSALFGAVKAVKRGQANRTGVRDLKLMLEAFEEWKQYYASGAGPHRERAAKLELIGDRDAAYERRQANSYQEDAARCDVGVRVLKWAIEEIDRLESGSKS